MKPTLDIELPKGILPSDLVYPSKVPLAKPYSDSSFELWYTEGFGWVIPTLFIARASRRNPNTSDRTYAVRVSDAAPVRVGCGPHVKKQVTVYVKESRKEALVKFLELREKGTEQSNIIRDRISSRRAQGALRRSTRWDAPF